MEDKVFELLLSIGLSKGEIEIYLDVLKNKVSTAYEIAKRTNQHRSGVYEYLKKLIQRGFIIEIIDEKRKLYQTKESTSIEEYLKQKQEQFKEITPYLRDLSNTLVPEDTVSISYGSTRVRLLLSNISKSKEQILIWTVPKKVNDSIGEWFLNDLNKILISKDSPVKIILSNEISNDLFSIENKNVELKYSEEESNIFMVVIGSEVSLIVLGKQVSIIDMKSEIISEGFKSRFNGVWGRISSK